MARLLLIKDANTELKTVGDIVGIYEDTHSFDPYELREKGFDVAQIEGKREDVVAKLNTIQIPFSTAYKAATTEWSQTRPEQKTVWQDADDKWYFLDAQPKYKWSMSLLSEPEKTTLENDLTGLARDAAFKNMIVNPGEWDSINQTEAIDLNK